MSVREERCLLLWSQAQQGPTEGQDWLFGPEGILGHLQTIRPMRRKLTEGRGRVFFLLLQLSESVFQLTKHVKSYNAKKTTT